MILNAVIKGGGGDGGIVKFSYTGSCVIDGNILRLLDSGAFTPLSSDVLVDLFLVGGGGGGGNGSYSSGTNKFYLGGGGAGGGYTHTQCGILLLKSSAYEAIVGAGGAKATNGGSTSFVNLTANGGAKGTSASASATGQGKGGNGGSGGGAGGSVKYDTEDKEYSMQYGTGTVGGVDGASSSGTGQGTTTRAFGEADGELFSTGGRGGALNTTDRARTGDAGGDNTGNGGGGGVGNGYTGGAGGSGIILIRFPEGTELAQVA